MSTIAQQIIPVGLQMIFNTIEDKTTRSMVSRWIREYETHSSRTERKKQILDALADGYDTVKEIVAATGISDPSVRRLLERLVAAKLVTATQTKNHRQIEYRFLLSD